MKAPQTRVRRPWSRALLVILAAGCADETCEETTTGSTATPSRLEMRFDGSGSGYVTSSDGTFNCLSSPGVCSQSYPDQVTLALTGSPNPGSRFIHWTDDCNDQFGNPVVGQINKVVSGTVRCKARFDLIPQVQVTVQLTGSGVGTVSSTPAGLSCPSTCTASFNADSTVTLTATPASSSDFAGWSGGQLCISPANPAVTFTAAVSVTCTVRFDPKPTAGVAVFSDDFDDPLGAPLRWEAVQRVSTGGASNSVVNRINGGVPLTGGYREGRHDFPAPGSVSVTHIYLGDGTPARPGIYVPAVSGAVDSLVVSMDVIVVSVPNAGGVIGAAFQVRQGQGYYFASMHPGDGFQNLGWVRVQKKLVASDFLQVPNFTHPMEFGFLRSNTTGGTGVFTVWGTDNFRVEVWHR